MTHGSSLIICSWVLCLQSLQKNKEIQRIFLL